MLQTLETFMTQSPDVQGVTIDFGDAPAHGRWRAMSLTIWLRDRTGLSRKIRWRRFWPRDFGHGNYDSGGYLSQPRKPYERVIHIKLNTWELKE